MSPPQGSLIFEEGGGKLDAVFFWDWGDLTELLHLEDPCFQRFGFLASEWRWSIRFDVRGWDYILDHRVLGHRVLLILHLGLELCDLIPQLLDDHIHVNRGMLGATGHCVRGFLYRAPRSWFWGDSSECLKSGYSLFWGSEGWSSKGFVDS